ncbi:alpha/beta fold hydrolase [Microcoleus sp. D3_18_C2]|uniref:alpha/beta fold hydrolase n=1 Tax=Microcoleus sp. D3_18_C2 TaxID=3055334 RepID=UPI002FCEE857
MSNFFTPEFNNESAIAPWNASLEPTKAIIPQLDANRVLTGGVGEEVNIPTLTPEAYDNIILPDAALTRMANGAIADSNSSLPDSSVDLLTGQAMSEVYGDLSKFAADPDFVAKLNVAFGENWDAAGAKALAEGWFHGDFSDIPPVKVVSSAEIDAANGAFAAATDTIYLSKEFLAGNAANPAAVADVLLEEIGHSVDARLNVTDSPGDEGAIFGAIVQGKELSEGELQGLKGKNDTATVVLGGEDTTIEMSQQAWVLGSYTDWRNRNFDFQKPDQITSQSGNRGDSKDGIYINWGKGSPFDPANTDIVNELNYFATSGYTQANFEAGKTYKFRVSADDNIVIGAKQIGQSGFNLITPLNQARTEPEWQTLPGIFKEYSWTPTQSGSYRVQFWHYDITGDASVDISWEKSVDSIRVENKDFAVNLSLYDENRNKKPADSSNLDLNKDTVVVIHGRGGGGDNDNLTIDLAKTAAASQYYPNSQVLYLDWKEAANDGGTPPYDAARRIRPVAKWATNRLQELGIDPQKTILLGHSLGSYVASEIGRISGGVKELVALDPAFPGGTNKGSYDIDGNNPGDEIDDRTIDFNKAATKSIALVVSDAAGAGGLAGDNPRASSANDSYIVNFIGYEERGYKFIEKQTNKATDYHNGVVNLFSEIMLRGDFDFPSHQGDRFSDIGQLQPVGFKAKEEFEIPRHEGVITAIFPSGINGLNYVSSNGEVKRIWNS